MRFLLWLCLLGFAPVSASAQALAIDKVLVIVNEEAITLSEYQARHQREVLQGAPQVSPFDGRIDPRILNHMIDDRIQAQTAARRGMSVSAAEVDGAVASIAGENDLSPQQLLERLAQSGITPAQFRASIKEQQLIRRLVDIVVNSRVVVSEREVENYLASHAELTASDDLYEVSHLFVSLEGRSDAEAQSEVENLEHIRRGLSEGQSFADAVRAFSDSANREEGGYLGWRKVSQLPQVFVEALVKTEVGGISEIIKSNNGLHLLELHERKKEGGNVVQQQRLRHVLIRPGALSGLSDADAAELASQLHARIVAGEDFEKIARAHSADQATGVRGGGLGWVIPGDYPPEFEDAARALPLNQVSQPVRTQIGYHLIEVLERRDNDISRDLAAKRARQMIFQRKAAEFYDNWYGAIRDTAYIEYVSADLNPG